VTEKANAWKSWVLRTFAPALSFLENIGHIVSLTARSIAWQFRRPFRVSQMLAAMDFIGVQSIFIVGLTGTFSGMVVALQTTYALRAFSAEGRVGGIVAVSLARELAPVFAAIMVTARAGSAMAAELGNMRVTEQIDAIATMGVSPVQYLLSPRLLRLDADGAAALRALHESWACAARTSSPWCGWAATRASSCRACATSRCRRTSTWGSSRPRSSAS
jgi:phospholipid/cholesterol/gamma-HCH transport system permease protein